MAFTEFYCDPTSGSNLNGGSDAGSPSMSDTAGTGAWNAVTNVYTSVATTGSVTVGQFMSIFTGTPTTAPYVARITAVTGGSGSAWIITLDASAKVGTAPGTNTNFKAKVGGAWKGPNGSEVFPFAFTQLSALNDGSHAPRITMLNNATYSVTTGVTLHAFVGCTMQGATTLAGDGGKFVMDGGTSGASYDLLTIEDIACVLDFELRNNGSTGTHAGLVGNSDARQSVGRGVVHGMTGSGVKTLVNVDEVESYSNGLRGFDTCQNLGYCEAHHNTDIGFYGGGAAMNLRACISAENGQQGFYGINCGYTLMDGCDAYHNGADGLLLSNSSSNRFQNCNFAKNNGYGITESGSLICIAYSCGFSTNVSGLVNGAVINSNPTNYGTSVYPWVDPDNGNFTINLAAAEGTGRFAIPQTASGYGGTVGYPDRGAAQHQDAGGGGGVSGSRIFTGM